MNYRVTWTGGKSSASFDKNQAEELAEKMNAKYPGNNYRVEKANYWYRWNIKRGDGSYCTGGVETSMKSAMARAKDALGEHYKQLLKSGDYRLHVAQDAIKPAFDLCN